MSKEDNKNKPAAGGKDVANKPAAGALTAFDYGADAGTGFEGVKGKDLSIPFITLLQANSPQVEKNDPEGSKSGMIMNSVTHQLIEGKVGQPFLPCYREDLYMEWTPRDSGGGLVDRHVPDSDVVKKAIATADKKFAKLRLSNGNDLVETYNVYGLTLATDGVTVEGFAVVSCSSTKITPFKKWYTNMFMIKGRPPLYAHRAIIKSVSDKNKKGQSYFNFDFVPLLGTTKASLINPSENAELLTEAKEFREMVISGAAKADFSTLKPDEGAGDQEVTERREPGEDAEGDGKAPF